MSNFHRIFWSAFGYVLLVLLSCFLFLLNYIEAGNVLRSKVLINELFFIRSSVIVYTLSNKKLPSSINQSIDFICANMNNCLEIPKDANNDFVDPFGNKYTYDGKTGFVKTSTDKYINW